MKVLSWGASDVGMKREHNEDSFLIMPEHKVFVVADGMGGHACGEVASGLAVHAIQQSISANTEVLDEAMRYEGPIDGNPAAQVLNSAMKRACSVVYEYGQENPHQQSMGTTTTAMLLTHKMGFIAHVGDSRCYLVRDERILQLSEDHSLVNEQLKAGMISQEQAEQSRFKNIITRSVGFDPNVEIDMIAVETQPHDLFLLCSDGLTGHLNDQEIHSIMTGNFLHELPSRLIDLANARGGEDNITVVLSYVGDESAPEFLDGSDDVDPVAGGAAYNAGFLED